MDIPAAWVCAGSGAGDIGLALVGIDGAEVVCVSGGAVFVVETGGFPHRLGRISKTFVEQ